MLPTVFAEPKTFGTPFVHYIGLCSEFGVIPHKSKQIMDVLDALVDSPTQGVLISLNVIVVGGFNHAFLKNFESTLLNLRKINWTFALCKNIDVSVTWYLARSFLILTLECYILWFHLYSLGSSKRVSLRIRELSRSGPLPEHIFLCDLSLCWSFCALFVNHLELTMTSTLSTWPVTSLRGSCIFVIFTNLVLFIL